VIGVGPVGLLGLMVADGLQFGKGHILGVGSLLPASALRAAARRPGAALVAEVLHVVPLVTLVGTVEPLVMGIVMGTGPVTLLGIARGTGPATLLGLMVAAWLRFNKGPAFGA